MKSITRKKAMYLLLLLVICLAGIGIKGTYAKFAAGGTTEKDIVSLNLSFNIGISNIEEYEEVVVEANDYKIFNVSIKNSSSNTAYYGVWYQMVIPSEKNDKIIIARSIDNNIQTTGSVSAGDTKVVTIIAKNNTSSTIKLNVGVSSSEKSTDSIEYLGGKKLISGTTAEADYYYDEATAKYIKTTNSSITFTTNATTYSYTGSSKTFTPNHDGAYKLEAWGAQGGNDYATGGKGGYTSGVISITKNNNIYIFVGGQNQFNGGGAGINSPTYGVYIANGGGSTDFRLINAAWNDSTSLASRIMVAAGGSGSAKYTLAWNGAAAGGSGSAKYTLAWNGAYGGGLQGENGKYNKWGSNETISYASSGSQITGNFGFSTATGAGGGYRGGATGSGDSTVYTAGGGSSYISGYKGCVAIISASDTTPKAGCSDGTTDITCSYHYSGKRFINATMIAGNASMPNLAGTSNITGNSGNGVAKVTPVVPTIKVSDKVINSGENLTKNDITCQNNGSGCQVVRITDTKNLSPGVQTITIVIKDDFGYLYKYVKTITIGASSKLLSSVSVGSYVKYTGTNGCSEKSCEGQNANYVSNSNMGYCYETSYKFNSNGWRVAYINDGTAYLTSGGSPECMCTDSSGNAGTKCSDYETTSGVPKHLANLNAKALTYCNSTYAYGGICNSSSAWNMSDGDFQKITGDTLSTAFKKGSGNYAGFSIISNGGFYWFATPVNASSTQAFRWIPDHQIVNSNRVSDAAGVRPVLRLKSSVTITSGSGTENDPYILSPN